MKRTELNDSTGVVFLQEIKGRKCKSGAEIIGWRSPGGGQFRGWRCGWVVGVVAALTFYYLLNPITNKLDCVVVSPL